MSLIVFTIITPIIIKIRPSIVGILGIWLYLKIPIIVIYKLNFFTEFIASFLVKIKFANILNILENKMIIPEITNSNLKKKRFYKAI